MTFPLINTRMLQMHSRSTLFNIILETRLHGLRSPGKLLEPRLSVLDEEVIDFLERQVGCLGITKVDEWDEGDVGYHEDEVGLPLQLVENCGCYHDDDEVLRRTCGD